MEKVELVKFRNDLKNWYDSLKKSIGIGVVLQPKENLFFVVDRLVDRGSSILKIDIGDVFIYYCYGCGEKILDFNQVFHNCQNKDLVKSIIVANKLKKVLLSLDLLLQIL